MRKPLTIPKRIIRGLWSCKVKLLNVRKWEARVRKLQIKVACVKVKLTAQYNMIPFLLQSEDDVALGRQTSLAAQSTLQDWHHTSQMRKAFNFKYVLISQIFHCYTLAHVCQTNRITYRMYNNRLRTWSNQSKFSLEYGSKVFLLKDSCFHVKLQFSIPTNLAPEWLKKRFKYFLNNSPPPKNGCHFCLKSPQILGNELLIEITYIKLVFWISTIVKPIHTLDKKGCLATSINPVRKINLSKSFPVFLFIFNITVVFFSVWYGMFPFMF